MAEGARTRYARCGELDIAYQVVGDGPVDILLFPGGTIPIDCVDEQPSMARFHRRLASIGRLLRFDRRGTGQSDRGSSAAPSFEQWAQDAITVMDAVGSERAAVLAPWVDAPSGLVMAAAHPERVARLVVINGFARMTWAPDYPIGVREEGRFFEQRLGADPDAVDHGLDLLAIFAPSVATDPAFRGWWDRAGNLGATPAMALAIQDAIRAVDVRSVLKDVRVPVLILDRIDNRYLSGHGRYLAQHIPDAKCVELAGADLPYWVGETGQMLDEIEEFLTGARGGAGAERVLATVLFTDIVGSTSMAAQLGDRRWRDLLDRHDQSVRAELRRYRGREVNTVGDGFVARFESPGRAIECALAIREALAAFDVGVRAGVHTGEIEVRGDDVAGIAVHIGARVSALANPGEILVSSTVKDLVVGSHFTFGERGEHELKGVPGLWCLYAVLG